MKKKQKRLIVIFIILGLLCAVLYYFLYFPFQPVNGKVLKLHFVSGKNNQLILKELTQTTGYPLTSTYNKQLKKNYYRFTIYAKNRSLYQGQVAYKALVFINNFANIEKSVFFKESHDFTLFLPLYPSWARIELTNSENKVLMTVTKSSF